jgi:hypothetical protein
MTITEFLYRHRLAVIVISVVGAWSLSGYLP